ncbi:P-loop ATPase, Sll1717 family [uncultured Cellulomonas sp.]|uniref:P-loop ATPase, Sll1717 family n=1 Tax=uncultured Cellulomonas sp. TaxID=189682 RepID=UPI0028E6A470|nr:AAA family ATPase [uncultured Cellulomonas sp.]
MSRPAAEPFELAKVDFGRFDAESDPDLLKYFLVTGTVREVTTGAKLVVGRKGSGKTALFRRLAATLDVEVVELDLLDYVFELHKGFTEIGLSPERAYSASWKLLIYSAMFAQIREKVSPKVRRSGDDILREIGIGDASGKFRAMIGWLKRVRRVDLPSVEGIASLGGLEIAEGEASQLSAKTAQAIDALEKLVREAANEVPVIVLIDRLDDAWDGSDASLSLITGAVRATRDIANVLESSRPAPVITFLRTDLWERLSFNDKNKMSQDIVYLNWEASELLDVIDLRVSTSAGLPRGTGWDYAFTGDEMRQRASAKTYMTKRAQGRPRDIVAFAGFSHKAAIAAGHNQIEKEDIYEAERRYSKHLLEELRDEIERHVRDFTLVINTLKALPSRTFTTSDWSQAAEANGLSDSDAAKALDQLFEASAVGVHSAGGAKGGSGTTFRYQDRHLRATETESLQVHLGLVRELGLKDK